MRKETFFADGMTLDTANTKVTKLGSGRNASLHIISKSGSGGTKDTIAPLDPSKQNQSDIDYGLATGFSRHQITHRPHR